MFITRAFFWAALLVLGASLAADGSVFGGLLAGVALVRFGHYVLVDARRNRQSVY